MAKDKPHHWKDIEINTGGRTVKNRYYVERGRVTVSTVWGGKPHGWVARRSHNRLGRPVACQAARKEKAPLGGRGLEVLGVSQAKASVLSVSFPKIMSARSDDASRIGLLW
jgi:hypothetical protein